MQWRIQGERPRRMPPLQTKIFLISCSFWENPAYLYVSAPPLGVGAPSYGESCIRPCTCIFNIYSAVLKIKYLMVSIQLLSFNINLVCIYVFQYLLLIYLYTNIYLILSI